MLVTLLTRVIRIRNVLGDASLEGIARWGWLLLSGVMIGLAVVVIWGSASVVPAIPATTRTIASGPTAAMRWRPSPSGSGFSN